MAAQTGLVRRGSIRCLSLRGGAAIGWWPAARWYARRDGRATAEEPRAMGLSWTSWDVIHNVRRADQAISEITDATRTERGFHAAGMEK
jgi:hypothetical protein